MGHPGTVVPVLHFAYLIRPYLLQYFPVYRFIIFNGDLCSHTTYGQDISAMAGLYDQLGISPHKGDSHRDLGTLRKNITRHIFLNFLIKEKI